MLLLARLLRRARAAAPRSTAECVEALRDDVLYTPPFQLAWWLGIFAVVVLEVAARQEAAYAIMVVIAYAVFTLPLLRFCCLSASGYQRQRFAVESDGETRDPPPSMPRREVALMEDQVLELTRSRQANRPKPGTAKVFLPQAKAKRAASEHDAAKGAARAGVHATTYGGAAVDSRASEANVSGNISELKAGVGRNF